MSVSMSTAVCLIACHGGPADHFATYADALAKKGYDVQIHATGPALKKFQDKGIEVKFTFSLDNLSAEEEANLAQTIAKTCSAASIIITDVGHAFDIKIQKALKTHATKVPSLAYYDNPEPFVPGGYSSTAAEVMEIAEGILFANETLAKAKIYSAVGKEIDFHDKKRFGIGYYPVSQAEKIAEKRKTDHETARSTFLMKHGIKDEGQKVLVYFGGNNEEYFSKAFPKFLSFVAESSERTDLKDTANGLKSFTSEAETAEPTGSLEVTKIETGALKPIPKNTVIVIQQHPGAKGKNQDGQQVEAWLKMLEGQVNMPKIILSDFSSDDAQVLADAAFYYQTSMGPQFALVGIPTVQIGHETYEDILVRNHLAPSVTTAKGLVEVIANLDQMGKTPKENLLTNLGIKENWLETLENAIQESI